MVQLLVIWHFVVENLSPSSFIASTMFIHILQWQLSSDTTFYYFRSQATKPVSISLSHVCPFLCILDFLSLSLPLLSGKTLSRRALLWLFCQLSTLQYSSSILVLFFGLFFFWCFIEQFVHNFCTGFMFTYNFLKATLVIFFLWDLNEIKNFHKDL